MVDQIFLSYPRAFGPGPLQNSQFFGPFVFPREITRGKVNKKKRVNSKFPKSLEKVKGG